MAEHPPLLGMEMRSRLGWKIAIYLTNLSSAHEQRGSINAGIIVPNIPAVITLPEDLITVNERQQIIYVHV